MLRIVKRLIQVLVVWQRFHASSINVSLSYSPRLVLHDLLWGLFVYKWHLIVILWLAKISRRCFPIVVLNTIRIVEQFLEGVVRED